MSEGIIEWLEGRFFHVVTLFVLALGGAIVATRHGRMSIAAGAATIMAATAIPLVGYAVAGVGTVLSHAAGVCTDLLGGASTDRRAQATGGAHTLSALICVAMVAGVVALNVLTASAPDQAMFGRVAARTTTPAPGTGPVLAAALTLVLLVVVAALVVSPVTEDHGDSKREP